MTSYTGFFLFKLMVLLISPKIFAQIWVEFWAKTERCHKLTDTPQICCWLLAGLTITVSTREYFQFFHLEGDAKNLLESVLCCFVFDKDRKTQTLVIQNQKIQACSLQPIDCRLKSWLQEMCIFDFFYTVVYSTKNESQMEMAYINFFKTKSSLSMKNNHKTDSKGSFFSESAMCLSNLQKNIPNHIVSSKIEQLQKIILSTLVHIHISANFISMVVTRAISKIQQNSYILDMQNAKMEKNGSSLDTTS